MYHCALCGQNDELMSPNPHSSYCAIYIISGEPNRVYFHEFKPEQQIDEYHIVVPGRNEPGYLHLHYIPISNRHDNPGDLFCHGFAFHHYCWAMLLHIQPDMLSQLVVVHEILSSFPKFACEMPQLDIGHTYGGNLTTYIDMIHGKADETAEFSGSYQPDLNRIRSLVSLFGKDYSESRDALGHIPQDQKKRKSRKRKPKKTKPAKDKISELPVELLHMILSHLPSSSVVRLMQTARVFYMAGLPDRFWQSRFTDGYEFGHLTQAVALRDKFRGCWRSVFMAAKKIQNDPHVLLRKKVYTVAVYLADIIDARTKMRICQGGMSPQSPDYPKGVPFDIPALIARQSSRVREVYLQSSGEDRTTAIRFVGLQTPVVAVFVSLITLGDVKYVAGLRIVEGNGKSQTLGYLDSTQEISMMTFQEPIIGFRFAIDRAGVRGVAMISSSRKVSPWVGDYWNLVKTEGLTNPGDKITWLEAEFDAVKLVKLWIFYELREAPEHLFFDEHCAHWHWGIPDLDLGWKRGSGSSPTAGLVWISLERPDHPTPYATGLTVYYDRRPQLGDAAERMIRLEVHFGRQLIVIGRENILDPAHNFCSRTHFYINGAAGERVTALEAYYSNTSSRSNRLEPQDEPYGFTIYTDRNSYDFFTPSEELSNDSFCSTSSKFEAKGSPAAGLCAITNNGIIQHVGLAYR